MHGFSTALTWERLFFLRVSARKVNTYSLLYHVLYISLFISLLVKGYGVDTHRETLRYHQLWPYPAVAPDFCGCACTWLAESLLESPLGPTSTGNRNMTKPEDVR